MMAEVSIDRIVFDICRSMMYHGDKLIYMLPLDHGLPDHIDISVGDVIVYPNTVSSTVLKLWRCSAGIYCALVVVNEVVQEYVSIYSLADLAIDKHKFVTSKQRELHG